MTDFARISGLMINVSKSVCVPLGEEGRVDPETVAGVLVLQPGASCRYLGIRVGAHDTHDENWQLCLAVTAARVAMAVAKTHAVQQRVMIAHAIIMSKIQYVARHIWPSRKMVEKLHKLVKGFVWGQRDDRNRKPWVKEQLAELTPRHGGLGVPPCFISSASRWLTNGRPAKTGARFSSVTSCSDPATTRPSTSRRITWQAEEHSATCRHYGR